MHRSQTSSGWRLIAYSEHDAGTNMAIDEAMLELHRRGEAPPTVRLYGFVPAAVSLGYSQKLSPEAFERMRSANIDVVRRPTGGRAVLHLGDLTYSFVGTAHAPRATHGVAPTISEVRDSADRVRAGGDHAGIGEDRVRAGEDGVRASGDPVPAGNDYVESRWEPFLDSSITGAYKQICQALIFALESLGVAAELGTTDSAYRQLHDCFLATTSADLHYQGKKMVGSAQLRRNGGVLQHGSILLNQDQRLMERLLMGKTQDSPHRHDRRHANLYEIVGRDVPVPELQVAIKDGFERAFNCTLKIANLTSAEWDLVGQLKEKYAAPAISPAPINLLRQRG